MKKTLSLLLCLCLLLSTAGAALAADMPFTDVPADAWYYEDVASAAAAGLINGKTADTFAPDDNLTCAEAVKLAAVLYQQHAEGEITLTNGDPWYQPYVDYMDEMFYPFEYEWTKPATRGEFMEIFALALPTEELEAVNDIPFGAIPDVPADYPQAAGIYRLYRAGIVQGSSGQLNGEAADNLCKPDDTIRRSEAAAILTRMTDKSRRISFSLAAPADAEAASWTFEGNGTLVILADIAKDEAGYPWAGAKKLVTSIRVADGVKAIGDEAFANFRFATEVTLPEGLETIGADAFSHCGALKEIALPDSVTEIGSHAFSKCYELETVTLPKGLEALPDNLFFDNASLTAVTLPENLVTIGERAFCRSSIKSIEIPVSVRTIEAGAFEDCGDLESVIYAGTDAQWAEIAIADGNDALLAAARTKG